MKLPQLKCNLCRRTYRPEDCRNSPFSISYEFGYESDKHDCETIELDLCPDCVDKLMEYIIKQSKINCIE